MKSVFFFFYNWFGQFVNDESVIVVPQRWNWLLDHLAVIKIDCLIEVSCFSKRSRPVCALRNFNTMVHIFFFLIRFLLYLLESETILFSVFRDFTINYSLIGQLWDTRWFFSPLINTFFYYVYKKSHCKYKSLINVWIMHEDGVHKKKSNGILMSPRPGSTSLSVEIIFQVSLVVDRFRDLLSR